MDNSATGGEGRALDEQECLRTVFAEHLERKE
jgi:hypothetical protein